MSWREYVHPGWWAWWERRPRPEPPELIYDGECTRAPGFACSTKDYRDASGQWWHIVRKQEYSTGYTTNARVWARRIGDPDPPDGPIRISLEQR